MNLVIPAAFLVAGVQAFAPSTRHFVRPSSARAFGVDPSHFTDLSQQFSSLQDAFTSFSLADALEGVDVQQAADAVSDAANQAADAASTAKGDGWFGFLTGPIGGLLQLIHSALVAVGVSGNAWGVSIILLTVLIKVLTFPLNKSQLESTTKMQAMQPAIKELQAKYQSNPEVMNQKIAEFYQANDINPLAGCLPSFAQIPVFIGLYRGVLRLASENKLDEPFLWLPNLEGPTYGADPGSASDWILKGWVDGVPSLGWDNTIAFLILPLLLVISQYVSMELMQPKTDDPSQQQSNIVLKLLPLMIGWFSLNVPAALCVYWFTNNIITTATSLLIRNNLKVETVTPGATTSAPPPPPQSTIFSPPRDKPTGFGGEPVQRVSSDSVKTITAVDAEVIETESDEGQEVDETPEGSTAPKKSRRKKKKKRKN